MIPITARIRMFGASTILQQAAWLAAAKIVQGICSILVTLLVARHLGPSTFGDLSVAIAAASMVATAGALGLEQVATREIAKAGSAIGPLLAVLRRVRAAGASAGFLLVSIAAVVPALHSEGTGSLLLILSLLPIAQMGDVAEWTLVAQDRSKHAATVVFVVAPLAALARLGLVLAGMGVEAFAWALVAEWALRSVLLTSATLGTNFRAGSQATVEFARKARSLLRDGIPFLLAGLAVFVYMRIDQFMIAAALGPQAVGYYSAAVALAEVPLVLPVLLLRAALPRLSRESLEDGALRDRTLVRLMRTTFYVHLAGAILVACLADQIIGLLYGGTYQPAAEVLRIQAFGAPFVALGVISGAWIVLQEDSRYVLWRTLAGALLNIVLNVGLIPIFGIAGAAAATVIAFFATALVADAVLPSTRPLLRLKLRALWLPSRDEH